MELDKIHLCDCIEGMRTLPDKSIDLIVTDIPYLLSGNKGGGFWGNGENTYNARGTRKGMEKLESIKDGITDEALDEMCRVMKKVNIYLFCSQKQIMPLLDYFVNKRGCNWNILTWHKTNPIPSCGNKYLNDTEYILFFREKGVKIYGTFHTKRTYYVSLRNQMDNQRYNHPTVKPQYLIENLIVNSSQEGEVVLDPYMGSGTTAVAAMAKGRHYVGYEINEEYYRTALRRIEEQKEMLWQG